MPCWRLQAARLFVFSETVSERNCRARTVEPIKKPVCRPVDRIDDDDRPHGVAILSPTLFTFLTRDGTRERDANVLLGAAQRDAPRSIDRPFVIHRSVVEPARPRETNKKGKEKEQNGPGGGGGIGGVATRDAV